jgi:hypothetical protein
MRREKTFLSRLMPSEKARCTNKTFENYSKIEKFFSVGLEKLHWGGRWEKGWSEDLLREG